MYSIKKVTLDCYKDGECSISMDLGFKKPGLELDSDRKKHRDYLKQKVGRWCSAKDYDNIVVSYKSPYEGKISFIFKGEEL